jgi:signal transduction histidine kinase
MKTQIEKVLLDIKRKLSRTIFTKYVLVISCTLLISFIAVALILISFVSDHWQDEQQSLLSENARAISLTAGQYVERKTVPPENGEGDPVETYSFSEASLESLRLGIAMIASSIKSDIFIVSAQGAVLICSEDNSYAGEKPAVTTPPANGAQGDGTTPAEEYIDPCRHRGRLPKNLINDAAKTMQYRTTDTLGGIYTENHFIVGIPVISKNEAEEDEIVAFVFAATSAKSIEKFGTDISRVVTVSIIIASVMSLFAVYIVTYQQIRPLRQMAAVVGSFASGDYNVRMAVTNENEVGRLASAFNEMAASIAASESMRRSFIANVSHELKTPMQTISGFIDGILDGTIPQEKEGQYLRVVSSETKRLARLVRSMLDLSRIDSGEMKLNSSKFDISSTIFSTLLSFEQKISEKNIDIQGLEDMQPISVRGDADLIHQVVYNLFDNAVKFTNEGGFIKASVYQRDKMVHVCISNSGIGIPSDELGHIFDRFYKTDKSRSQDKTGVGLGLYIVKTIVTLHGGRIEARSMEGNLCEFEFYIPISGNKSVNNKK